MNRWRTWIEINQDHFDHNISQYKRIIGLRNLSIVVKANAYGHGLANIAQLAQNNSTVHSFCVATIREALEIRKIGATKPILILSVLDSDPTDILNKNIAVVVYDLDQAQYLQSIAKRHNAILPVHIKIDTGLSRLGIEPEITLSFIHIIQKMPNLEIEGIYSHCAESHKKDNAFTLKQRDLFHSAVKHLKAKNISIPLIHFANSAATTSLDLSFCNFFRIGIGAYGLWPGPENKKITQQKYPWFNLKPILTWKTSIRALRNISKGSFIGYDRTHRATQDMRIAILPIGYYDGYDFRLFNKGSVLINGVHAPIIGRISMNLCSIDISHIPSAQINDKVILMGPYPQLSPAELGKVAGNSNVREMTTKINTEIPRLIKTEKKSEHQKELFFTLENRC